MMVRAAASGMIDFSKFDPWDNWWWKKLSWIMSELADQQGREVTLAQHNHWITMCSHGGLTEDSFEDCKASASQAYTRLLQLTYPWNAHKIGADGTRTAREDAVATYHKIFGNPGEPRYEEMLDALHSVMKKGKQSSREKDKSRKMRKLRRQQAREQRMGGNQ